MASQNRSGEQQEIIDLQKHLRGVDYPASRDELLEAARRNRASPEVMQTIEQLGDERFETPADVMKGWKHSH